VEKGLKPGEKVVTDGQIRLMPGAKVEIKEGLKTEDKTTGDRQEAIGKGR
jgi:multidrug efflux system membrane fusion protein